ncbi:Oidioi.mRNA.OKI2018_I69.PAR.g8986.t1.cds [Oikopleura dioica]|uniref:Oidioi.mRNA.OKI2018_I69.PAR.g8986.t1.cds n=1 Tax=Oikopleura dioica TaxID=34765 RepID=A0ABN7RNY3_OIKDI|nr:Oidioi.mRNA.OKI2018_I69.PAR.g8986.t1.cds [Oikopleura dioica]
MLLSAIFLTAANAIGLHQHSERACPDQELMQECMGICRVEYNYCRLLCETDYCLSICQRQYDECNDACPCGADCPAGCAGCDNPICPIVTTEEIATTTVEITTTVAPTLPPPYLYVIMPKMSESYLYSGNTTSALYEAAFQGDHKKYTRRSVTAMIQNVVYIFGGEFDNRKIAYLSDCSFVEVSARLNSNYSSGAAAISLDDGTKALICFEEHANYDSCELFDGKKAVQTHSTNLPHLHGALGMYYGQPTTMGGWHKEGKGKTETYTPEGWRQIVDHPKKIAGHSLIGLPNGSMLLVGGKSNKEFQPGLWILKKVNGADKWESFGELKMAVSHPSTMIIDSSIFVFPGAGAVVDDVKQYPLQRIDFIDESLETISDVEHIGDHENYNYMPVLFFTSDMYCLK